MLLQSGAKRVYAVDVGYGQLAWSLRSDSRVVAMERQNARYLTPDMFPERMDLAVMDLSFISLKLVLSPVGELIRDGAPVLCLIKPQFGAGREDVGKKGVVRDRAVHERVLREVIAFAPSAGYSVMGMSYSPIRGPEGNIEYLGYLKKGVFSAPETNVPAIVEASHAELEK